MNSTTIAALDLERTRAQLAPEGRLCVGLNYGNFLLVLDDGPDGQPRGIAPDLARELARRFGATADFTRYEMPGDLADAVRDGVVTLGFLGAEPQRAQHLDFSDAYLEIEAGYMVRADSGIATLDDVDRPGMRIAVVDRSAYDLWLTRHIRHASLVRMDSLAATYVAMDEQQADVVAGLKQGLLREVATRASARLIEDSFTAVRQSMCIGKTRAPALAFLDDFVAQMKASQYIAGLIRTHAVGGVRVAA